MKESKTGLGRAFDDQLTVMDCAMMSTAQRDEIEILVRTASRAQRQVMDVDERCMTTTRHHAATVIAPHHSAASGRRDTLGRSSGTHVGLAGGAEVLRIARSHLHDLGRDRDEVGAALLKDLPTPIALGDGYLVVRATAVDGPLQDLTCQEEEQGVVVVQRRVAVAPEVRNGIAKEGEGFGVDLEAEEMQPSLFASRIAGFIAWSSTSDQAFELA